LSSLETDILQAAVRVALEKPVKSLMDTSDGMGGCGGDVSAFGIAMLTGHDERAMRTALQPGQSLCLLGLLEDRGGEFRPTKTVIRLARIDTTDPDRLRSALVGKARKAELAWEDFAHLGGAADLAERILWTTARQAPLTPSFTPRALAAASAALVRAAIWSLSCSAKAARM
jgi:hypothetical protein